MWLLVFREPLPDAAYWSGRRGLAALDAVLWPLAWCALIMHLPAPAGVVGPAFVAVAVLCGLQRLHRALWLNHRYRFTTWRWGRWAVKLLLLGLVMKLVMVPTWPASDTPCSKRLGAGAQAADSGKGPGSITRRQLAARQAAACSR